MPMILDFQVQPLSAETYSLTVCERGSSQPLATATFSHRVDFLTDFSVDRLNAPNSLTKDAAERFDELQKLGRELYQKLFPPAVEQVWRDYKQRSEFLILCLRFAEGATKLEVLPWETLHDGAEFIAAGAKTTLTRLPLDVAPPSELPPIPRPLKLFGFFASPLDLQDHERLNAEHEQEILLEAINDPAGQGRISADFEDEAKLEILERSLRDGYHILHFTGHGISPRDGGGLLLEDAHGKKLPASIAAVMQAIPCGQDGNAKLRLAVISGCQTARTLHTGAFSDLARELLRKRVPAVIAMQFSITDEGGLKFAEVLYREIAKGIELERAVHAARRVLLADQRFFINNDALAIVLLTADGACLQTTAAQSQPPQAEPGATYLGDRLDPLAHGFYGRRREYRKIRDALLHQDQRAVIIHGIGGIGKTALLTHAINRLRPRFKDVMSFDCRRAALAPETILLELSRYFATQEMPQLQSLIGQNVPPETLADEIAKLLTKWPLLVVFDNFESQLDERRAFLNDDLRVFLTTLVRATATGSRFLFTTRYLFNPDGEQLDDLQELPLGDLSRPEALMLMQKLPNLAQAAYRDKLAVLEKFGGHPYALVTLDRYCSHQPLNQAMQDASLLKSELREFLAIELNYRRLSDRARELLNRFAAFRAGVPFTAVEWVMGERVSAAEILMNNWDTLPDDLKAMDEESLLQMVSETLPEMRRANSIDDCLRELLDWGLLISQIENGELQSSSIHPIVRDFCRNQQQSENWCAHLRDAASFYTNRTKLVEQDDKSQAMVWCELEAFELLIEAGSYTEAAKLLIALSPLLIRWGVGSYIESQYPQLSTKADRQSAAVLLLEFGNRLLRRGKFEEAEKKYNQALAVFQELGNLWNIGSTLHQIGRIYEERGEHDEALRLYEQSLRIAEDLGNRSNVALTLHQIGLIHEKRGKYDLALTQYERSLIIERELGNRGGVAASLHQIGTIHQLRGEYNLALTQYEQSLRVNVELDNHAGVALSLHQIGYLHYLRGEYEAALQQFGQSLRIAEELGDRAGIARSLHQIGMIYQDCGRYDAALEQHEWSLGIAEELGDQASVASSLGEIGVIYQAQGEYEKALAQYERSLRIAEKLNDRVKVAVCLHQMGVIHQRRGDYQKALWQYEQSLRIAEELGDKASIAESRGQLGKLFTQLGSYPEAFEQLLFALFTFAELQSPNVKVAIKMMRSLRAKWGVVKFDKAWRQATNDDVPKVFKD